MENKYIDRVAEFVYDEQKIVTYKWLSKELKISMNLAKKILLKFYDKNKSKITKLTAIFCVIGLQKIDENEIQKICIVPEKNVNKLKQFMKITSSHIYSIQQCILQDSNSLYITDLNEKFNASCSIKCQNARYRKEKEPNLSTPAQTEENLFFRAKETSGRNKIVEDVVLKTVENEDNKQKCQTSAKKNSIACMFQKVKTLKQLSEQKEETKLKTTEKLTGKNKNCEEKQDLRKTKDNRINETKKTTSKSSAKKKCTNKRKGSEDHSFDKKRHKRIRVFADDSSDSDEGNDENIEDTAHHMEEEEEDPTPITHCLMEEEEEDPVSVVNCQIEVKKDEEEEEDPLLPAAEKLTSNDVKENGSHPSSKPTILSQKLVSKRFVEDDYLVTKKVFEMVEEPESSSLKSMTSEEDTNPSVNNLSKPGRTNKLSLAQHNKKPNIQQKQSLLMSYFKKT